MTTPKLASKEFEYLLKIPGERRTLVATHPIR